MSAPDAKIYPHATGLAEKTVEEHKGPQDLVFYAGWFCPFSQRSWIALEERGIPYQYKEVNPFKKEKHFLAINPKGLVPAIEYKGKALYESLVLCEFFEDAFPDYKPHLLPSDAFDRGVVRFWVDHVSKAIVPGFFRLLQAQEPDKQKEYLEEYYRALRALCENVKGPYFLGNDFTLVDVALAPWAVRDYNLVENRGYSRDEVGKGWKEYAEKLETRETVRRTTSDREHYGDVYGRYLRNEAQTHIAKAIRAGRTF